MLTASFSLFYHVSANVMYLFELYSFKKLNEKKSQDTITFSSVLLQSCDLISVCI